MYEETLNLLERRLGTPSTASDWHSAAKEKGRRISGSGFRRLILSPLRRMFHSPPRLFSKDSKGLAINF